MIPVAVTSFLKKGAAGEIADTPKAGDPIFQKVQNLLIGNNQLALAAAKEKAEALGYHTLVLSSSIEGEARKVAIDHMVMARDVLSGSSPICPPACIISGGETTVTIRGDGLGGRNQEFALAAAIAIDGLEELWCSVEARTAPMVRRMRREGSLTGQRFNARETRDVMHEATSKETIRIPFSKLSAIC